MSTKLTEVLNGDEEKSVFQNSTTGEELWMCSNGGKVTFRRVESHLQTVPTWAIKTVADLQAFLVEAGKRAFIVTRSSGGEVLAATDLKKKPGGRPMFHVFQTRKIESNDPISIEEIVGTGWEDKISPENIEMRFQAQGSDKFIVWARLAYPWQ